MCCEKHCAHDERTETPERRVLHDIGFFGHFIYTRRGGRGGKQHVLKTLYYADGQMTQRVLLEKTKTTSASLSEVVGKLEPARRRSLPTRNASSTTRSPAWGRASLTSCSGFSTGSTTTGSSSRGTKTRVETPYG